MPTMSIRVDNEFYERISEAAAGEGTSVSDWTRQLIASSLGLDEVREWSAPTTLSKRDRKQLALLHRILEVVSPDEEESEQHAKMVEVLQQGFTGEYTEEFVAIDDEMPLADCRLVWSILDMFRVIQASANKIGVEKLKQTMDQNPIALTFRGFDLSDQREGPMLAYAQHLIETGRWEDLAEHFDDAHERGNSHLPLLDAYLRMIDAYTPIWTDKMNQPGAGLHLNADELKTTLEAAVHPSRRTSAPTA